RGRRRSPRPGPRTPTPRQPLALFTASVSPAARARKLPAEHDVPGARPPAGITRASLENDRHVVIRTAVRPHHSSACLSATSRPHGLSPDRPGHGPTATRDRVERALYGRASGCGTREGVG